MAATNYVVFTVQVTLQLPEPENVKGNGPQTGYDAQQLFLEKFPQKFGPFPCYDARIVSGLLDKDDVPIKQAKGKS